MRLTVGPLPAAVYWRRRAFVLGGLLLAVFVLMYSCAGGTAPNGPRAGSAGSAATPTATSSLLTPTIGDSPEPEAAASAAAAPAGSSSPAATASCSDAEISVTAAAESTSVAQGSYVKLTLKIKNVSSRTCTRDAGADAQELYLQDAASTKMWSSDACDAPHGTDVRALPPAIEYAYFVWWNGHTSSSGCTSRPLAPKGTYLLVGRLATKFSEPVQIHVV
jgi:hypothetical protein